MRGDGVNAFQVLRFLRFLLNRKNLFLRFFATPNNRGVRGGGGWVMAQLQAVAPPITPGGSSIDGKGTPKSQHTARPDVAKRPQARQHAAGLQRGQQNRPEAVHIVTLW